MATNYSSPIYNGARAKYFAHCSAQLHQPRASLRMELRNFRVAGAPISDQISRQTQKQSSLAEILVCEVSSVRPFSANSLLGLRLVAEKMWQSD